jgi:hypothetical protein
MSMLLQVLIWGGVIIAVYVLIAVFVAVWTIFKHRDEAYKIRFEEFVKARRRVRHKIGVDQDER